jgi:hypothetical protein
MNIPKKSTMIIVIATVWLALCLPSAFAETFSIPLKQGKNLISIPITSTNTSVSQVLQSINGIYSDVWRIDPTDAVDPWKHYSPTLIPYSDLTKIEYGRGYYVSVNQNCVLTVSGSRVTQNYTLNLAQGWNLIGWPYLYPKPYQACNLA